MINRERDSFHTHAFHRLAPIIVIVLVCMLAVPTAAASPGEIDPTFGEEGQVITTFPGSVEESARALAVQSDDKIVVVGGNSTFSSSTGEIDRQGAVARYAADGELDRTFGNDGTVAIDFGLDFEEARDVVVQPDGKIIVVGTSEDLNSRKSSWGIARLMPNGTLDNSFGTGGLVTTNVGSDEELNSVALQADGRIVVAGTVSTPTAFEVFAVGRYHADGKLDATFGDGGTVQTGFQPSGEGRAFAVAVQPNGRIVVVGHSLTDVSPFVSRMVMARYRQNGNLDTEFSGDGRVVTHFRGGNAHARDIEVKPDGTIVVGGNAQVPLGSSFDFAIAQYRPNGALDRNFSNDGKDRTRFTNGGGADALAVQPNGEVVLFGSVSTGFGLVRYRNDGSLDPSFGRYGRVRTHFESALSSDVALQSTGRIIAAGYGNTGKGYHFLLVRYLAR